MAAWIGMLTAILTTFVAVWLQKEKDKKTKKEDERPQIHGSTVVRPVTKETPVSFSPQGRAERPQRFGEREEYGRTLPIGKKRLICPYCSTVNIIPEQTAAEYACYFCWKIL